MALLEFGNVVIIDYSDIKFSKTTNVIDIVNHTVNTWQYGRSYLDKQKDTELGKMAEDAVMSVFNMFDISGYYPYDDFRSDNFELHAPFDGVFTNKLDNNIVNFINNSVQEEGNRLSIKTRDYLRENNVYTVEIKSTRLTQKYKDRANFSNYNDKASVLRLIDGLMNLDYLTYPHYTRYGDMSYYEYCEFVNQRLNIGLHGEALYKYVEKLEMSFATDIYIRVFMDEFEKKALIMGWIDKERFFNSPRTHKLILPGKSEVPLYFVKSLKMGSNIKELKNIIKKATPY